MCLGAKLLTRGSGLITLNKLQAIFINTKGISIPPANWGVPPTDRGKRSNMSWRDNDELTTVKEGGDGPPALSKVLEMARPGDVITARFENDGREIETSHGDAVVFEITPIESDVPLRTSDGDDAKMDGSETYAWITSSSRLLSELAEHDLEGKEFEVEIVNDGVDARYDVRRA